MFTQHLLTTPTKSYSHKSMCRIAGNFVFFTFEIPTCKNLSLKYFATQTNYIVAITISNLYNLVLPGPLSTTTSPTAISPTAINDEVSRQLQSTSYRTRSREDHILHCFASWQSTSCLLMVASFHHFHNEVHIESSRSLHYVCEGVMTLVTKLIRTCYTIMYMCICSCDAVGTHIVRKGKVIL